MLLSVGFVFGQQVPLYEHYLFNQFLLNPAVAGSRPCLSVRLVGQQQWLAFPEAPQTQTTTIHGRLGQNGVGLTLFNDSYGAVNQKGMSLAYAYHLPTGINYSSDGGPPSISFGLSLSGYQFSIDKQKLELLDPADPALYNIHESFVPDATAGLYIYNARMHIGLSIHQLLGFPLQREDENAQKLNAQQRYYIVNAAYLFDIKKHWSIEPSFLFNMGEDFEKKLDINLRLYYDYQYWLALSYSHNQDSPEGQNIAFSTLLGVQIFEKCYAGYVFRYSLTPIRYHQFGTHGVMLGYDICYNPKRKKKSKRRTPRGRGSLSCPKNSPAYQ